MSYEDLKENPISPWFPRDSSTKNYTGKWALSQPKVDDSKCTKCMRCWVFCPDSAITFMEGTINVDKRYCKGCGICEVECPVEAISMVSVL